MRNNLTTLILFYSPLCPHSSPPSQFLNFCTNICTSGLSNSCLLEIALINARRAYHWHFMDLFVYFYVCSLLNFLLWFSTVHFHRTLLILLDLFQLYRTFTITSLKIFSATSFESTFMLCSNPV